MDDDAEAIFPGQFQERLGRFRFENRTQDSRDLNEPPSNIRNGLGVFSAFNSLSVTLR